MKKLSLFLLPFLFCFFLSCEKTDLHQNGQAIILKPVEIRAEVDKARATIGDVITLSVTVNWRPDIQLRVPEFGARITDLNVMDTGTEEVLEIDGRKIQKKWIKLRADAVGSYRIPSLSVPCQIPGTDEGLTAETAPIFIEIESALGGKEATDLPNEIRPLELIPADYRNKFLMGLALLLAGLLAYLLWKYLKKRRSLAATTPLPSAHEVALQQLENLKKINANDLEAIRKLYFELSEVFRRYLQNRFKFPAVDWTTEEILPYIGCYPEIVREMKEASLAFFRNTDQVKFARHFPGPFEIGREFETAEQFIHNTKEGGLSRKGNGTLRTPEKQSAP